MDKIKEQHFLYILITLLFLLQVFLLLFNGITYGGADNVNHFQIARYAFKYPELFFDLWGKPVYTTLLAPFAQLGYNAAKVLNLAIAIITILLTSRLSNQIHRGSSLFIVVLLAFAPVYFFLMITCLTEVLFSLALILAVYLFFKNKFALSAIILSFIPFIRSEGMVLFPVFALAFVLKRSYWPILLLSTGTLFYTITGYFVFSDILWIKHKFPYPMGENVYGSGSLFHFVKKSNYIFGIPFLLFLIPGIIFWLYQIFRDFSIRNNNLILFVVIVGSWAGYFAAHSYVWWKGTGASLGLERVIGGVLPLAALTCIKGFEFIHKIIKNKKLAWGLISFLAIMQIFLLFNQNQVVQKADPIQRLIVKAVGFVKQTGISQKIYFFNPEFIFHLEMDPYDQSKCNWGIGDRRMPSNSMNYGDILIWDAHFGPNEGGVSTDVLEKDSSLQIVKTFLPVEKITVLGGYDYSIRLYKKVHFKKDSVVAASKIDKFLDIDNSSDNRIALIDGQKAWKMDETQEYSPNLQILPNEIKRFEFLDFNINIEYKGLNKLDGEEVSLVFSIENEKQNIRWENLPMPSSVQDWKNLHMKVKVPANIPESSKILVYVWNTDKKVFYIKSFTFSISSY